MNHLMILKIDLYNDQLNIMDESDPDKVFWNANYLIDIKQHYDLAEKYYLIAIERKY